MFKRHFHIYLPGQILVQDKFSFLSVLFILSVIINSVVNIVIDNNTSIIAIITISVIKSFILIIIIIIFVVSLFTNILIITIVFIFSIIVSILLFTILDKTFVEFFTF